MGTVLIKASTHVPRLSGIGMMTVVAQIVRALPELLTNRLSKGALVRNVRQKPGVMTTILDPA